MSWVIRECAKCKKEFKAIKPIGMDEIDLMYWNRENALCEACSGEPIRIDTKTDEKEWSHTNWTPEQHDGNLNIQNSSKSNSVMFLDDLGDE